MTLLQIEGVQFSYRHGTDALRGVDLSLDECEVVGLIGRNGAGKTTLLKTTIGLLVPLVGRVSVMGLEPTRSPIEVKRRVGFVSENQVFPDFVRVDDLLDVHRKLYPTWDVGLEKQLLTDLNVDPRATIGALSKGQARKVALLCAIAHRPRLLILDEPSGGLDPSVRREFLEVAINLLSREGTSILFSSHHMADIERIASRVALLDDGQVLLDRSMDDLKEGFCVATFEAIDSSTESAVLCLQHCMRVRRRGRHTQVVFGCDAQTAEEALKSIGLDARCAHSSLEDFFIAVVGEAVA